MFNEIRMRPLCAIEEVFVFILLGFGGAGVGVWVGDLGCSAVLAYVDGLPGCDYGGEGAC